MEITICVPQIVKVTHGEAKIGEIATIVSNDTSIIKKLQNEPFYRFEGNKGEKKVFGTTAIVECILRAEPEATVQVIGEAAFILEYAPKKPAPKWVQWLKVGFVTLAVFFGAAFSILTFHYDVGITDVFDRIYGFAGIASPSFPALEVGYTVGLPLGIIVFFNHFSKLRFDADPTPLKVQMRTYENEVNSAIIANAARDGKEQDNA